MKRTKILMIFPALIFLIAGCNEQSTWPQREFSATAWKSAPESERYAFVSDLISRHVLIGLRKAAVLELLGNPASIVSDDRLAYLVKTGGSGFDQVFLLEIYLSAGLVTEVRVRGD